MQLKKCIKLSKLSIECDVLDNIEFGLSYFTQASNVSLPICCSFCADYNICKAYTYYPRNRTCFLYDSIYYTKVKCPSDMSCQSGQVRASLNISTTMPSTTTKTSTRTNNFNEELTTVNDLSGSNFLGFYSTADEYQLRFFNMSSKNYSFFNNISLASKEQYNFIKKTLEDTEINVNFFHTISSWL